MLYLKPRSFACDTLRAWPALHSQCLGWLMGKLAPQTGGLRWLRQQLRELDHGFKPSHSWMLSKVHSWYWSALFWSCFRWRRCITCCLMAQFQVSINLTGRKFSYAETNLANTENPDTEQSQKLLWVCAFPQLSPSDKIALIFWNPIL